MDYPVECLQLRMREEWGLQLAQNEAVTETSPYCFIFRCVPGRSWRAGAGAPRPGRRRHHAGDRAKRRRKRGRRHPCVRRLRERSGANQTGSMFKITKKESSLCWLCLYAFFLLHVSSFSSTFLFKLGLSGGKRAKAASAGEKRLKPLPLPSFRTSRGLVVFPCFCCCELASGATLFNPNLLLH